MHSSRHPSWLWLLVVVISLTPLLSACSVTTPPVALASSSTPLPQVVEAYMAELPGPSPKLFQATRVFDRQGALIGEFWQDGHRYWVPLERIAPAARQATIATEDKSFYTNPGVDWSAIARAVLQNSGEGEVISGASTITQQLARNIAMPYERRLEQSLDRKISETVVAQDLTQRFSKDQILEMYLNVVYYGHMAYGIEAAAHTFFAKSAANLTLAESAILVALPQSPAGLDPLVPENRTAAKARQGLVLALMARNGYIKQEEAEAAFREPLQFKTEKPIQVAPHFVQYLHDYLVSQYGTDLVERGGLTVVTTLDSRLQTKAQSIVRQQVDSVRTKYNLGNAALVALKPGTGQILAMVGSADYNNDAIHGQVNVTISRRQPGSAIKPVLYSLAFTRGMTPADVIVDGPVAYPLRNGQIYRPVNYDGRFHGTVRLRQALANSYNVPAVKLLAELGIPGMLDMAHAFGLDSLDGDPDTYGLALTLGGSEVTPLELTGAFATLANGGMRLPPDPILHLIDSSGHEVRRFGPAPKQVVDPRVAYMVTSILSDNEARTPAFGPNSPLKLTRTAAAKTGTTTDFRDNWTVGFTPYVAVGVWAGNSDGKPMQNTTGLTGAAPIWHDFMEALFADPNLERAVRDPKEPLDFQRPPGLLDGTLCKQIAAKGGAPCPPGKTDLFIDPAHPVTIGLAAKVAPAPTVTAGHSQTALTSVRGMVFAPGQVCTLETGGEQIAAVHLPSDPGTQAAARAAASQAGVPVEVGPCTPEMQAAAEAASNQPAPAEPPSDNAAPSSPAVPAAVQIAYPPSGAALDGPVNIIGTVAFDLSEYQFYKVEFGYGGRPGQWVTMGTGHNSPVSDGRLETWHTESVPNGLYALRVVLVKRDGNYVASDPVSVQVIH